MSGEPSNVFQPPASDEAFSQAPADDPESVRRRFLPRESQVMGLSLLFACLTMWLLIILVLVVVALVQTEVPGHAQDNFRRGLLVVMSATAVLGLIAVGLRFLHPVARYLATLALTGGIATCLIGAVREGWHWSAWPAAAILTAGLAPLWWPPANQLFARTYRHHIRPATPHLKARAPLWAWFLVGATMLAVVLPFVDGG